MIFAQNYAPEPSGNAPYVTSLAEGLQASGEFDLTVVTAHPYYPDWQIRAGYGQWKRDETLQGVRLRRRLHYVPRRPTALRRLVSELSFGVRSAFSSLGRPDVVVLVSPSMFASAVTMLRLKLLNPGTPVLVWVQDLYSLGVRETGGRAEVAKVVTAVESWLFRTAGTVTVIHERFRHTVTSLLGVEADRVRIIRNWTHISPVEGSRRAAARSKLSWGGDEIIALHTGNMGVKQGLENVVRAAELAERRGDRVRFVFIGGGNQRDRLVDMAAGLTQIEFIGSLPDDEYALALTAADVLLVNELPGVSGMAVPSKLTSYFAAGRPVVAATDAGGVTDEEVTASRAGVRVGAGDARALLDAVIEVGADAERSSQMGLEGVRYYERLLSPEAAIDAFKQALRDVRRSGRSKRRRRALRRS
ncbi:glycosyltransferase family 4 protein [Curtobacterium sp. YC1]|uniref:glycosyltransferase family 4 protein n=1 Tax=Curtobacterium sp. YC1 TaxID=2795488 RepID=UPI001E553D7A|nr:glycosyltransferase family 4 protein [Curtobacterium sp. YC1]